MSGRSGLLQTSGLSLFFPVEPQRWMIASFEHHCRRHCVPHPLPGGAIDLGESVAQAAVRQTLEESGIECPITGIVGIYSDPGHVILYTSNGEVRQEFSIVLTARALSGRPTPSSESSELRLSSEAGVRRPGWPAS
jgi:ADP-ribose pyrophosphatase YjhB (NUDIX family)